MSVHSKSTDRPPENIAIASNINTNEIVANELYSLLDAIDTESIADEFSISTHCKKHDFDNQFKTGLFEGINSSDPLAELDKKQQRTTSWTIHLDVILSHVETIYQPIQTIKVDICDSIS